MEKGCSRVPMLEEGVTARGAWVRMPFLSGNFFLQHEADVGLVKAPLAPGPLLEDVQV